MVFVSITYEFDDDNKRVQNVIRVSVYETMEGARRGTHNWLKKELLYIIHDKFEFGDDDTYIIPEDYAEVVQLCESGGNLELTPEWDVPDMLEELCVFCADNIKCGYIPVKFAYEILEQSIKD